MNLLLSFHYYGTDDLAELTGLFPTRPTVFADSGGFSAHNIGADVSLDVYAEWCARWTDAGVLDCYANLDVIGDAEATWQNQQRMEAEGLAPLPVFHGGEPWEYLDRYLAAYPYVCLGGMVASSKTAVVRWLVECHRRARAAGVVLHGFGQTDRSIVRQVPFYTVDSSSWGYGHRFGWVFLWDARTTQLVSVRVGTPDVHTQGRLLRAAGLDPAQLSRPGYGRRGGDPDAKERARTEWRGMARQNARAFLQFQEWLTARFGAMDGPVGPGPAVFLADGSNDVLDVLAEVEHE